MERLVCNLPRMLLRVSCQVLMLVLHHLQWLPVRKWVDFEPPWSTIRCPAWLQLTWPLTVM